MKENKYPYKVNITIAAERLSDDSMSVQLDCDTETRPSDWPTILSGILLSLGKGMGNETALQIALRAIVLFQHGNSIDLHKMQSELQQNNENTNNNT